MATDNGQFVYAFGGAPSCNDDSNVTCNKQAGVVEHRRILRQLQQRLLLDRRCSMFVGDTIYLHMIFIHSMK